MQPKRAAAAAGGVPKDDQYDYEDNFIDDSEIIEYYAGDRRKAKHSGFFVNSGEIEKVRHTLRMHLQLHGNACICAFPSATKTYLNHQNTLLHGTEQCQGEVDQRCQMWVSARNV